jgi:ribonuclease Z
MRRKFLWVLATGLALLLVAALALRSPAVSDRMIRGGAERAMAGKPDALFGDDALRVLLCGSGSPFPDASRAKACVAVFAAGRVWVVDTGPGSWNRLALLQVDGSRLAGVLLTHFHSDHIGDLGEFNMNSWVMGRRNPLRVFGPPGVERVVAGFSEAYALDSQYRIAHHGAEFLPPAAAVMEAHVIPVSGGPTAAVQENGLQITAFAVNHSPVRPAYGYRFDYRGRSAVVSGDTAKDAGLVQAAKGADLLVHEALAPHLVGMIGEVAAASGRSRIAKVMGDIPSYHTTPVQAAEVANDAGVKLLVLYHLVPALPSRWLEPAFVRGVSEVRPKGWRLAQDGLLVELPVGSDAVEVRVLD